MSFVSAFINNDFASIMSDGRVISDNKKVGGHASVVEEDFKKVIKINNFLIGFTGNAVNVEFIIAAVKETINVYGEAFMGKELLLSVIKLSISKYKEHSDANVNVVLIGFSDEKPCAYTIKLLNKVIHDCKVDLFGKSYQLITLCPFDYRLADGSEGVDFIKKIQDVGETPIKIDEVIEMQSEMNRFVSDNSDSVNKIVFCESVINKN